jgi:hypothetical protein
MTIRVWICFLMVISAGGLIGQNSPAPTATPGRHTYRPEQGYVPDATTAIAIAQAVWLPIYGKKTLDNERPFQAALKDDVWTVKGTFHSSHKDARGGVAVAEISRIDARVLRVSHGM